MFEIYPTVIYSFDGSKKKNACKSEHSFLCEKSHVIQSICIQFVFVVEK